MYRRAFMKADRNADGFCEPSEVNEVLARAGLPNSDDARSIWLLTDIKQRGRLNFAEFACAMYIAFRRAKGGVPLPAQLPQELLELATSNTIAGAPSSQEQPAASQQMGMTSPTVGLSSFMDLPPVNVVVPPAQPAPQQPVMQQPATDTASAGVGTAGYPQGDSPHAVQGGSPQAVPATPLEELQKRLKTLEKADPFEACSPASRASTAAAAPQSVTVPVFFATGSAAEEGDPFDDALSVKELKARLTQHGADFTGIMEKRELLALLKKIEASKKDMPRSQAAAPGPLPTMPGQTPFLSAPAASTKHSNDPFAGLS